MELEQNDLIQNFTFKANYYCNSKDDLKNIINFIKDKISKSVDYNKFIYRRTLLIIYLVTSTGIKINEICKLLIEDINVFKNTIKIKDRLLQINDDDLFYYICNYIDDYKYKYLNDYLLSQNTYKIENKPITESTINRNLKDIGNEINVDINYSSIRNLFIKEMIQNDCFNISEMSFILDISKNTLNNYIDVFNKNQNNNLNKISYNTFLKL